MARASSATSRARPSRRCCPGVQYHHERWDGTGYPEGLKGEDIPFLGRLLGVADFYDALTSARSYRGAMPAEEAIALIAQGSGRHFDPAIAAALLRIFDRDELHPRRDAVRDPADATWRMIALRRLMPFVSLARTTRSLLLLGACLALSAPRAVAGGDAAQTPAARFDTYPVDLRVTPTTTGARLRLTDPGSAPRHHGAPCRRRPRPADAPLHRRRRSAVFRPRAPGTAARRRVHGRRRAAEAGAVHGDRGVPAGGRARRRRSSRLFTTGEAFATRGRAGARRRAEGRRRRARQRSTRHR